MKYFKDLLIISLTIWLIAATYCYVGATERWNFWMDQDAVNQELIDELRTEVKGLQNEIAQLRENPVWKKIEDVKITYYWPGEDQYGSMTSTGVIAEEGRTIAVDPTLIPYGTEVMINGQIYIAEDCGGAVKGKIIDIFVEQPHMDMYYTDVFIKEN